MLRKEAAANKCLKKIEINVPEKDKHEVATSLTANVNYGVDAVFTANKLFL